MDKVVTTRSFWGRCKGIELGRVSGGGYIRVTIDSDSNNRLSLLWKIFKGLLLCKKFPEIRKTSKGYHLIWGGLKIDFKKHFVYRKFIGDDISRIHLDMNPKRIGQVLFTSKMVLVKKQDGWEKMKHCKICGMPLTQFWVYKYDDYYCIKCGVQNVKLLERINQVRDEQLFKFLDRVKSMMRPFNHQEHYNSPNFILTNLS